MIEYVTRTLAFTYVWFFHWPRKDGWTLRQWLRLTLSELPNSVQMHCKIHPLWTK